jgi:hypothetical protein
VEACSNLHEKTVSLVKTLALGSVAVFLDAFALIKNHIFFCVSKKKPYLCRPVTLLNFWVGKPHRMGLFYFNVLFSLPL